MSIGLSIIGIMIYVAFRFEMGYGIGAVVSTIHDVLMTIGIFRPLWPAIQRVDGRGDPAHRRLFDQRYDRGL